MDSLDAKARSASAGACALIADGDDAGARQLLSMYLGEAMPLAGPMVAMQRLVAATLGVAVAAADGADAFRRVAGDLAVSDGEWV